MNNPIDPYSEEKDGATAYRVALHRAALCLWNGLKKYQPTPRSVLKGGALLVLIGSLVAVGANYLPKAAGQSRITAVEAAQSAFALTNGGIITEAEFDIGRDGSRFEFEILSGGREYDVQVDAMSGQAWLEEDD